MPADRTDGLVRVLVLVVALVLAVPLLLMAFAMPMMGMMGVMGDGMVGMSPLWGVAMMVLWLAVFVAIGYVVYRAVTRTTRPEADPAMEELRRAYARGDLTDEEFEARRERLKRE